MRLPDTENANYHYAFKKGYRMAMEGRPLSHMPSQMKYDGKMREYFQMGWEHYHEELNEALENESKPPWKSRAIWAVMMVVAGLGTASLMISNIQNEKALQQKLIDHPETTHEDYQIKATPKQATDAKLTTNAQVATQSIPTLDLHSKETFEVKPEKKAARDKASPKDEHEPLGLLNEQSRKDLAQAKRKTELLPIGKPLEPIHPSGIDVKVATFARTIRDRQALETFSTTVPKYIRQLYFFTQVSGAQNQTIYHRWLYQGRVMAIIPLKIKGNLYRTWSSKRLSSAWPGQWTVEVLNDRKQVIYRKHFNYIRP